MELIDKCGKINKVTFKQIVSLNVDKLKITSSKWSIETTTNNLLVDLFSQDVENDANEKIKIKATDVAYVFTGKDFNWFLKADRLSDLSNYVYGIDAFSLTDAPIPEPKKKTKEISTLKVADTIHHIATVSTKSVDNIVIHDFKGAKVDCIKWLNQQIVQNSNLDNEVEMLICLDYEAEDLDWKSLKELFDEGKIDIC